MQITKTFTFNAWHRLLNYDGVCSNVHGHNYLVEVTLSWELNDQWIIFDFKELKPIKTRIDSHRDHAFIYESWDPIGEIITSQWLKTYTLTTPPSTENLCLELISQLEKHHERAKMICEIVIWETPKCKAVRTKK